MKGLLAFHGDAIEQEVFWRSVDLLELDVDLVFYDATTAWFETDETDVASHQWRGLSFEPLRQRGHSKEGRDNDPQEADDPSLQERASGDARGDPQVVIALAVTRDGIPVRSWIFPGNTPDVATVARVKDDLRDMRAHPAKQASRGPRLGRTLFVGDAGLYSKANLEELAKGAGKYILATPIRRITMRGCGDPAPQGEIRDEVLSHPGRYAEIAPNLRAKVVLGANGSEGERRRRYILCLTGEEAERQKWRRAALLETLDAELAVLKADHPKRACQLLSSRRFAPYLSQDENSRPYLDRDKVKRAEHLDGKFVLTTNDDTLSVADIALGYKGMWIIESCFRRMKTTGLEVRPMLHLMPQRITAHVKLCVLALMIQRAAESTTGLTWRQLHDLLTPIKAVRYTAEGRTIVQASKIGPEASDVLKKLDISTPKTILDVA